MKIYPFIEQIANRFGYTILKIPEYYRLSNNSWEGAKAKDQLRCLRDILCK